MEPPAAAPKKVHVVPDLPWYRSNIVLATLVAALILGVNWGLVSATDHDILGTIISVFFVIPVANILLGTLLLFCSPLVRSITGWSATLHVWVSTVGCLSAIFIDGTILL